MNASMVNNMPARAVVPVLPITLYKEQSEKEFERSLEYVRVQRRILKHLERRDIALDTRTAYTWTCDSTKNQWPKPLQALRLCYYMRSLGFDTFAHFGYPSSPESNRKEAIVALLIANPDSEKRGVAHDHIYWVQSITTGRVYPKAYKLRS